VQRSQLNARPQAGASSTWISPVKPFKTSRTFLTNGYHQYLFKISPCASTMVAVVHLRLHTEFLS
jgi:hypothetical protein